MAKYFVLNFEKDLFCLAFRYFPILSREIFDSFRSCYVIKLLPIACFSIDCVICYLAIREHPRRRKINRLICLRVGSHDPIFELLKFEQVSDANQQFYELKQRQKNNWIQKMDHVNRPLGSQKQETKNFFMPNM